MVYESHGAAPRLDRILLVVELGASCGKASQDGPVTNTNTDRIGECWSGGLGRLELSDRADGGTAWRTGAGHQQGPDRGVSDVTAGSLAWSRSRRRHRQTDRSRTQTITE